MYCTGSPDLSDDGREIERQELEEYINRVLQHPTLHEDTRLFGMNTDSDEKNDT